MTNNQPTGHKPATSTHHLTHHVRRTGLVAGAEDVEAHRDGAAGVRGFDADELAAWIGVVRVGAVEGDRAAIGLAVGGERLEQVVAE